MTTFLLQQIAVYFKAINITAILHASYEMLAVVYRIMTSFYFFAELQSWKLDNLVYWNPAMFKNFTDKY